jgi:galactokinase
MDERMTDFARHFGGVPDLAESAPGRVNLIGEHTDYNGGFVLPTPIPQRTTVELSRRDDDLAQVVSDAMPGAIREYRVGHEKRAGDWLDYVQGCTRMLGGHAAIGGFQAAIASTVPVGAGLSSSAALEVALLRALRAAFAIDIDDVTLALTAHRAEHDFVGARVGVMDQMVASLGTPGHALLLDARSLAHEAIRLPDALVLRVIDSGIAHRHAGGDYNTRRAECETACERLGIAQLRDLEPKDLRRTAELPDVLARRVRHVVTENARVGDAVAALRDGDVERLGRLLQASHASLRDDYEVSIPEVDALVEIAAAQPEVVGARMTGGGFGGAVLVAAGAGSDERLGRRIVDAYVERTGAPGRVLV